MNSTVLDEAKRITESRVQDYGAIESFTKIAQVATLLCNKKITDKDVCKVLIAVKLIRESKQHKRDNLVDLAGYTRLLSILESEE